MLGTDDYLAHAKPQVIAGRLYDQYGYAWRNCTSYAAIQAVFDMGRPAPLLGDGGNWYNNAELKGIPRGLLPKLYAFAVFLPNQNGAGPEGHVAEVTAVNDDSTIDVAEYNFLKPLAFGTRQHVAVDGLRFVYEYIPPTPPVPLQESDDMLVVFQAKALSGALALCLSENFMTWRHLEPEDWAQLPAVAKATGAKLVNYQIGTPQTNLGTFGSPKTSADAAVFGVPFNG